MFQVCVRVFETLTLTVQVGVPESHFRRHVGSTLFEIVCMLRVPMLIFKLEDKIQTGQFLYSGFQRLLESCCDGVAYIIFLVNWIFSYCIIRVSIVICKYFLR